MIYLDSWINFEKSKSFLERQKVKIEQIYNLNKKFNKMGVLFAKKSQTQNLTLTQQS